VNNRVGKTVTLLQSLDEMHSLIAEHESMTMVESRRRGNCCTNIYRMWSYRKIVTQEEQYKYNLRKIEEWKAKQSIKLIKRDMSADVRPDSRQLAILEAAQYRDTFISSR